MEAHLEQLREAQVFATLAAHLTNKARGDMMDIQFDQFIRGEI